MLEIPPVEKKQNVLSSSKPVVQSGFNDQFGRILPPGYTDPLMEISEISRAWVINCRYPSCFSERSADDKFNQVAPFFPAFFVPEKHRANLFL